MSITGTYTPNEFAADAGLHGATHIEASVDGEARDFFSFSDLKGFISATWGVEAVVSVSDDADARAFTITVAA